MIENSAYEFRIVLVGESGVGKSSLLIRFIDDKFNDQLLSTIGVDFHFRTLDINGEKIKLQIWDTAGNNPQELRTIDVQIDCECLLS